ncbi:hypothetical protein [Lachnoclostridium sp. An181]|uniref:hypothetical protein n=1 Tax=Lachnoclostridium sp. An181 TaxID=1965575 RepID=UPI000B365F9F|nr:hypothetical protein [Lachnoclostridium sp. An181]OUP48653.1 hypothetical protein B5F18_11470 [Lachnoclostridium sp. An181]
MTQKTLEEIAADVERVFSLNDEGNSIKEISSLLALEEDYIYSILVSRQGYSEDPLTVAHMIMMEME